MRNRRISMSTCGLKKSYRKIPSRKSVRAFWKNINLFSLKAIQPELDRICKKKIFFYRLEKSVSVDIFSRDFFKTNSTRAETFENQVYVVFWPLPDLPGGIYRRWNLGILPNNGKISVLGRDFGRSPKPRADTYPQMGSGHNINHFFERFSASRVV